MRESPNLGSRRERKKLDKLERIRAAAAELFDRDGYDDVTTAAIAQAADVAAGTVFRYAASKAELLVMVINERITTNVGARVAAAPVSQDAVESLLDIFEPVIELTVQHPRNAVVYYGEILFGDAEGVHRQQAREVIASVQTVVADILRGASPTASDEAAMNTAMTFIAGILMDLVRSAGDLLTTDNIRASLAEHIKLLLYGFLPR